VTVADEPPPQPTSQKRLPIAQRRISTELNSLHIAGNAFACSLLLNIPHFIGLGLGLNVHFVIQLFHLILRFPDVLNELHLFL